MKQLLPIFALLTAMGASAQLTTITASTIQDGSGATLTGTFCVGANACAAVASGVLGTLQVANPTVAPVTITSDGKQYLFMPSVSISGETFDWDAYIQPAPTQSTGIGVPYFHCIAGAVFINSAAVTYHCSSAGAWSSTGDLTPQSVLATGIVDGTKPVTITTGTSATLGGTYRTGRIFNQYATAATGVAYTLPTASAGREYCVANSYNGTAANTGILTVNASAAGQFIIFTNGTLSATGGNVTSGGAAADSACFVGVDSTHWQMQTVSGTWTKH